MALGKEINYNGHSRFVYNEHILSDWHNDLEILNAIERGLKIKLDETLTKEESAQQLADLAAELNQ